MPRSSHNSREEDQTQRRAKQRAKKQHPSMKVSGRGMKRFAGTKPAKKRD